MKHIYKSLIFLFVFLLCFAHNIVAFQDTTASPTQSPTITSFFTEDFWVKVTIAVVSALLAFIGSYVLALKKERSEPKKQLSYDKTIRKEIVEIQQDVKEKVQVLYNGRVIKDLYRVSCNIENTGNTVIKNQYIRFEFPDEAEILESFFDPLPEREMGVQDALDDNLTQHEKRYLIRHIERTQQISFRFVLTCPTNVYVELHPYNEEGNVDLLPRTITVASAEKNVLEKFVVLYLMFYLIPPILYVIPFGLGEMAASLVRLGILVAMFPTIKPAAKIIADLLAKIATVRNTSETRVSVERAENIHVINAAQKDQV